MADYMRMLELNGVQPATPAREIIADDVESLSTEEMRDSLSVLQAQKVDVERLLNRAPEKVKPLCATMEIFSH
jgi:hypothetical protein